MVSCFRVLTPRPPSRLRPPFGCPAVRAYHTEYYRPDNLCLVVIGGLGGDAGLAQLLSTIAQFENERIIGVPKFANFPANPKPRYGMRAWGRFRRLPPLASAPFLARLACLTLPRNQPVGRFAGAPSPGNRRRPTQGGCPLPFG